MCTLKKNETTLLNFQPKRKHYISPCIFVPFFLHTKHTAINIIYVVYLEKKEEEEKGDIFSLKNLFLM